MNSSYLQPANRAFGLEIGNNRHETSFLGRRRTLDQQPISKPLCNYDRESFPHGEHPC